MQFITFLFALFVAVVAAQQSTSTTTSTLTSTVTSTCTVKYATITVSASSTGAAGAAYPTGGTAASTGLYPTASSAGNGSSAQASPIQSFVPSPGAASSQSPQLAVAALAGLAILAFTSM